MFFENIKIMFVLTFGFVIYGGSETQTRKCGTAIGWKNIEEIDF